MRILISVLPIANFGKYKEAIEANKQAIRIDHDHVAAHYSLADSYAKLGMYKKAIEAYKQAIRINPDDEFALVNLGYTFIKAGMYKEAD